MERCAVIGVGQTKHDARRIDVSQVGLVREAAERALADAELGWKDIDAVVIGKAPDLFEGVMMPELFLADALGCAGKPMLRVHTAGSVGGSTAIVIPPSIALIIYSVLVPQASVPALFAAGLIPGLLERVFPGSFELEVVLFDATVGLPAQLRVVVVEPIQVERADERVRREAVAGRVAPEEAVAGQTVDHRVERLGIERGNGLGSRLGR